MKKTDIIKLFIIVGISIFTAETLIMIIFNFLLPNIFSDVTETLVDAIILLIILSPVVYFFLYVPMQRFMKKVIASEEKFRLLFDTIPDAVIIHDADLFLQVNNVACTRFGYSYDELLKMSVKDINSPKYDAIHEERITQLLKTKNVVFETEHMNREGIIIPTELSSSIIEYAGKKAILSVARDITERKQAEEKLKQSEILLIEAQRIAKIGNWEWDIINQKTYWSENYFAIYGYSSSEIEPSYDYFRSRVHPNDLNIIDECFENILKYKRQFNIEFRIFFSDGSIKWVENRISPVFKDDVLIKLNGINIDITERKKIEEELIELNATKDKFFSIIAHDLRNPFAGLLSSCQLLKRNIVKQDMDKIERHTNSIYSASMKAFTILEDLLVWAKLQMGKCEVRKEKFNIHFLIRNILTSIQNIASEKEIEILIIGDFNANAFFDIDIFKLLVRNFTINAIKYSHKGDKIVLEITEFNENKYMISVKDTGIGINEEDIPKLFRIDVSHSTHGTANEKGTGLGLILCKEFAEKNGSEIFVKSEEGKGSTFSFTVDKNIDKLNME